MSFATVPTRVPGVVDVSWWNALKTAGMSLETFVGIGAGSIIETTFTFANNQSSPAVVTGLILDKTISKSAEITISVRRKTSSDTAYSIVKLDAVYREDITSWDIFLSKEGPDASGLTFTIDASTGQVSYTSTNMAGTGYTGASRFRALTFGL